MERKKTSICGTQKRKLKKEKEEALKKHPKLDGFAIFIRRAENHQASTSFIQPTMNCEINTVDVQKESSYGEQNKYDNNAIK